MFHWEQSRFFNRRALDRTHEFYERHGGKTIIIARFVPIDPHLRAVRGRHRAHDLPRFLTFNVVGGVLWVASLVYAGYFFGNIPVVRNNLTVVIFAIIGMSLLPIVLEVAKARLRRPKAGQFFRGSRLRPRRRRVVRGEPVARGGGLGEVALDAGEDRARHLVLVGLVVAAGVPRPDCEMNAVSTRIEGMSGAFSTAKPACSTLVLVQRVDLAELGEHRAAELEAVVDGRGLRQVEQRLREVAVLDVEVHAADEVRVVLALGEPARRRAGGAALRQREHRRAARVRLDEGVGVDRDEEVGLARAAPCRRAACSGMK